MRLRSARRVDVPWAGGTGNHEVTSVVAPRRGGPRGRRQRLARGAGTRGPPSVTPRVAGDQRRGEGTAGPPNGDVTPEGGARDVIDGPVTRGDAAPASDTRDVHHGGDTCDVPHGGDACGDATHGGGAHDVTRGDATPTRVTLQSATTPGHVVPRDASHGGATPNGDSWGPHWDGDTHGATAATCWTSRGGGTPGDVTCGGATRGNPTHGDVTHEDPTHGDATHGDPAHGDITHGDASHGDPAHGDVTHGNVTHGGATRGDVTCGGATHGDATHGDPAHGDVTYGGATHGDATHRGATHSHVINNHVTHRGATHGGATLGQGTPWGPPKRPGELLGTEAKRARMEAATGDRGTPGSRPGQLWDILDMEEEPSDTESPGSSRVPSPEPPAGDTSPDSAEETWWPLSPGARDSPSPEDPGGSRNRPRLRFEISSQDGLSVTADTLDGAWRCVLERVQEARASARLRHLSFTGMSGLRLLGLHHDAVIFLLEQLPGAAACARYRFRFHPRGAAPRPAPPNPSGCARAELYARKCTFDMFSFLASQHRVLPAGRAPPRDEDEAPDSGPRRATSLELPMAMRFRHLKRTAKEAVGVYRSAIHGRGLFCKRNIDAGEMVIEYSGMVIRSVLSDQREKRYDSKGIGCYMFRIDDLEVVDATMHGSAARFINHSCEPNCYSRVIHVEGHKRIVIFALRRIRRGEELTYDYKFPIEEPAAKLPCNCGAKRCRRFLN